MRIRGTPLLLSLLLLLMVVVVVVAMAVMLVAMVLVRMDLCGMHFPSTNIQGCPRSLGLASTPSTLFRPLPAPLPLLFGFSHIFFFLRLSVRFAETTKTRPQSSWPDLVLLSVAYSRSRTWNIHVVAWIPFPAVTLAQLCSVIKLMRKRKLIFYFLLSFKLILLWDFAKFRVVSHESTRRDRVRSTWN